jgi:hypothetical protein
MLSLWRTCVPIYCRPTDAAKVHELLKRYLDQRIEFYSTRDRGQLEKIANETAQIQRELWSSHPDSAWTAATPVGGSSHLKHE